MRDPFSWSFPIGFLFGIAVRIHVLFPLVVIGIVWREGVRDGAVPNAWIDAAVVMGLLFVAVLLHELGHCFAARQVDGEANEVLLWPLGGLARVDVPHNPRANFITALGGPTVNLILCAITGLVLAFAFERPYQAPLNPVWPPFRDEPGGSMTLATWTGVSHATTDLAPILLSRFFWVNWVLFLLNMLLVGIPLDGGRMLQCVLWKYIGYRQATLYAVYAGFGCMFVVLFAALLFNQILPVFLAGYIYVSCKQEWFMLEMGGEESVFGYDFSQGYTSLEREDAPPPKPKRKKQNFIQRWLQKRAAQKMQRELETQIEEERRMDELLDKIQRHGKDSLTDEEQHFLKRVADRYKNNKQ